MTDQIRYDLLVQDALKSVVRRVLVDVARDGLPGDHHFYVSFRTDRSGVRISQRLRERYPNDMTIVLQHQFDGLTVTDQAFEVGLSFSGVPERLRVPFDTLTGFFDPSVQFGLKFETSDTDDAASEATPAAPVVAAPIPRLGGPRTTDGASKAQPEVKKKAGSAKRDKQPAEPTVATDTTAEVVSLDSFRKKS